MYLRTSRLQYNLQECCVFQKARSDKIFSDFSLLFHYIILLRKCNYERLPRMTIAAHERSLSWRWINTKTVAASPCFFQLSMIK